MALKSLKKDKLYEIFCQYDSEDGLDDDDDSIADPDFQPLLGDLDENFEMESSMDNEIDETIFESPNFQSDQDTNLLPHSSKEKRKKQTLSWKKKNLFVDEDQIEFSGDTALPDSVLCSTML